MQRKKSGDNKSGDKSKDQKKTGTYSKKKKFYEGVSEKSEEVRRKPKPKKKK